MGLFGADQWEGALPGGSGQNFALGSIDTAAVLSAALPDLHADSVADLAFWTEDDLINWMDEGLKRLARAAGVFIERDTSIVTVNGTALYSLPNRQNATLHVSFGTAPLRPAAMIELEMRDDTFQTVAGNPDHWYEDGQGWHVGITPVPTTAVSLPLIMAAWPAALDTAKINTLVQAPPPVAVYLAMYVLAKAYGREGESEMPDVAQHCEGRCQMFEQIFQKYYGAGL